MKMRILFDFTGGAESASGEDTFVRKLKKIGVTTKDFVYASNPLASPDDICNPYPREVSTRKD
jgi:hypothetical protein